MINKRIIKNFEKLVLMLQQNLDSSNHDKNDPFRLKQLTNVLITLKNYPKKITLDNYMELKNTKGIGAGTLARIKEILETKTLEELKDFVNNSKEKNKILEDLETVVGIGHVTALEYYNMGVKSVKDLKKKVKSGLIEVNEKILLGLKYYKKFEGTIPRAEITEINKILKSLIKDDYIYEICGSYRREKITSNDIDVLISKKKARKPDELQSIVAKLKLPIKKNNNNPLIVDDITELGSTKYMGFLKYLNNPIRRIDIRFVDYENYYSALVYFTGSAELNKQMRLHAKKLGLKLSEYGLKKKDGTIIPITSEKDIFDILGMPFLLPRLR